MQAARSLAEEFHRKEVKLVYGGGTTGLMGEVARVLVSLSGPEAVHGIIPRALIKIAAVDGVREHQGIAESKDAGKAPERVIDAVEAEGIPESEYGRTTIVSDMHTRKRMMAEMVLEGGPGSGFVSLAGGFGTIEEIMEMTTWNQLNIHKVGVVLLNINGYWDGLLAWVRNAVQEGYITEANGKILMEAKDVEEVLQKLLNYRAGEGQMKLDWGQE